MTEKITQFLPEDEEAIASFAKDFACDPEMLEEAGLFRMDLLVKARNLIFAPLPSSGEIQLAGELMYEAKFMGEVVRRAEVIRQFQGTDDVSRLDRVSLARGLGSMFDENSPIRQRIKALTEAKTL